VEYGTAEPKRPSNLISVREDEILPLYFYKICQRASREQRTTRIRDKRKIENDHVGVMKITVGYALPLFVIVDLNILLFFISNITIDGSANVKFSDLFNLRDGITNFLN
jgi:hypothetical protein